MTPLLSVIVPVYNTEKYLEECLESILDQTFVNYEILLVDDGSTDNSGEICDAYAEKYNFIRVIHKKNAGIANTRKTGFLAARGKYISYVDSDKTIDPAMYAHMITQAQTHHADIVLCNILLDMGTKKKIRSNRVKSGFYNKAKLQTQIYPHMLFGGENGTPGVIPSLCNKIIKRNMLEKVLLATEDSISFGEDALCSFPCLLDAERVYVCDEPFYHYRMVETSVTHVYDPQLIHKFILLIELLDQAFTQRRFDGKKQMDYYTVRFSLDIIRNELLYNKQLDLKQRMQVVYHYLEHPRIAQALEQIAPDQFEQNNAIKINLMRKKKITLLFILFYIKNMFLNLWRNWFGKNRFCDCVGGRKR